MDIITIDGMVEADFRNSVEDMLRLDQVDEAVARLQALVDPYCQPGGILPECFAQASRRRAEIVGWQRLGERLADYDRADRKITGIGVTLADATTLGGSGPSRGRLAPFIKTYYFTDDAYPFSTASRDDLLDGYSRDGFEWQGDYQATDASLSIRGLDDLYGPIVLLERKLLAQPVPDPEEIRAGTIGACFVAVLIHRGLRDAIRRHGMPRPLCVIAACDGVYPLFDAPVAGIEIDEADLEESASEAITGSLLNLISRRPAKAMALALSGEDLEESHRFDELAAAQRLEARDEHTPTGSLDLSGLAPATDAWSDEDWALEEAAHHPAPAGWAPPIPERIDVSWLPEGSGVAPIEEEKPAPDFGDSADEQQPGAEAEASVEPQAVEPTAYVPLERPAHSLRARIGQAPVAAPPEPTGLAARVIEWLRGLIPGR